MPQYDEDMQRRRQKREAQRKKQQAEARRMKWMLILAVLVLVLCGVGIYLLVQRMGGGEESVQAFQPVQETEAPTQATRATSPAQQSPITTIHIKAAGDLNITDSVITSGLSAGGYDYSSAFKDVAAILSDADLTVMNFEGNVCGEPYGTETTSAPAEILQGLRAAGVDLLQMANSCSINNGLNGLNATLRAIRNAGIEPMGAYSSTSEFRASKGYTITEVQGIKVAFVAFTKGLGGRGMPAGNEDLVNLLYTDYATEYQKVDKERIETILKNVEAEKPDITIAMLHWGSEYNDDISKTQGTIISLMQKNGVDVIIGTHPHLVQPIVFDEAAGTLVAYSLGDFFGDASRGGTNYSIILDIEITKDSSTGVTKVTDYSYTPIYTVKPSDSEGDYSYSRVMRIEKALEAYNDNFLDKVTATCAANMEYALERIEARLVMKTADS
ncbi:MAG: CapA family protein [Faecousia sp.]